MVREGGQVNVGSRARTGPGAIAPERDPVELDEVWVGAGLQLAVEQLNAWVALGSRRQPCRDNVGIALVGVGEGMSGEMITARGI